MHSKIKRFLLPTITISFIIIIYTLTAARFPINYADSLELITAAKVGGLAHPPSYPMYTLFLHLITNMPGITNIARIANYTSVLFQTASLIILYAISTQLIYILSPKTTNLTRRLASAISTLILALSYQFWFHSLVVEVFPLNHIFLGLFIYLNLKWYQNPNQPKWQYLASVIIGLAIAHHQTIAFLIPGWILFIALTKKVTHKNIVRKIQQSQLFFILNFSFIVISFLTPFLILFYFHHNQAPFSWYFQPTIPGLIDNITRKIYTHEGSAIEIYAREINIQHSIQSILIYLQILISNLTLPALLFAIAGLKWIYHRSKPIALFLILSIIISGPALAAYLKFPIENTLSDAGYYAGTALRIRMFLLNFYLIVIATTAGIIYLVGLIKHQKQQITIIFLVCLIPFYLLITNYKIIDRSQINFDHVYFHQILNDLPQDAILIVQSDSVFGLIYVQLVENARPDITIIPSVKEMRHHFFQNLQTPIALGWYEEETQRIADIISWNLYQNNQVFILEPEPETLSYLGVEGNPFFAIPSGYVIEIAKQPRPIEPYNYGITKQLFDTTIYRKNIWESAVKGIFAVNHTLLGYLNNKAGSDIAGTQHFIMARNLARSQANSSFIEQANAASLEPNFYLNAQPPSINQYQQLYQEAIERGDTQLALNHIRAARFLDPTNPEIRQNLIKTYQLLGDQQNTQTEQQNLNIIQNLNSSLVPSQ